ncbi:MAG: glutathione synthase [Pseudonocardia sp.]
MTRPVRERTAAPGPEPGASNGHRSLEIVFVVDPVESLDAAHDSSVALMEAAQARGHRLLITTMADLGIRNGQATAVCTPLEVEPATLDGGRWRAPAQWYRRGGPQRRILTEVDVVFVRTDPPVDARYLRGTYLLDRVDDRRTLVVNAPSGLREANEKLSTLRFPDLCPPTVVSADADEIVDVTRTWGVAVVKPTDGMAGRGVLMLRADDANLRSLLEIATARGRDQVIVQRFLPESVGGDRRVIVLDGAPVGAVRRIARDGEFRCNMAAGARVVADSVTGRDVEICTRIAPVLATHGLHLVGIDVIGDHLTEINVTSPTGLREIQALCGIRCADAVVGWVEIRCRVR